MELVFRKRFIENAKFLKKFNQFELYERSIKYLHKRLLKCDAIVLSKDKFFLNNHKLRIGLLMKCLHTSGSLSLRIKRNFDGKKRKHPVVWDNQRLVTTSAAAFRMVSTFYQKKEHKNYKLIVIGGTEDYTTRKQFSFVNI